MKPLRLLRDYEALEILRAEVDTFKTNKLAAEAYGVSAQYLGDVLAGRRAIGKGLANALGYEREFCFVPLEYRE